MIDEIGNHASHQIGAAEERAVFRRRSPDDEMVAAAGAGVAPVEHEFVGAQARLARLFVDGGRRGHDLFPRARGVNVHLEHAGIGRHLNAFHARIGRGQIPFDAHRNRERRRRLFDLRHQLEVVLERFDRR